MSERLNPKMVEEADKAMTRLIVKHPDSVRLRPIMLEIIEQNRRALDYSQPFDRLFAKLYAAAKIIYRARSQGENQG